jgi:hypothetical protein
MDEPRYTSTRTDADSYADQALTSMQQHGAKFLERQQDHVRDALVEAFLAGEHQGECRAIVVLSIARRHATDPATRAALGACLRVLGAGDF